MRSQQLRDPLFELGGGDDCVILQILTLPLVNVFLQLGPAVADGIEISTAGLEPHRCQAKLVAFVVDPQELLIIEPQPQPFGIGTSMNNHDLETRI